MDASFFAGMTPDCKHTDTINAPYNIVVSGVRTLEQCQGKSLSLFTVIKSTEQIGQSAVHDRVFKFLNELFVVW